MNSPPPIISVWRVHLPPLADGPVAVLPGPPRRRPGRSGADLRRCVPREPVRGVTAGGRALLGQVCCKFLFPAQKREKEKTLKFLGNGKWEASFKKIVAITIPSPR